MRQKDDLILDILVLIAAVCFGAIVLAAMLRLP